MHPFQSIPYCGLQEEFEGTVAVVGTIPPEVVTPRTQFGNVIDSVLLVDLDQGSKRDTENPSSRVARKWTLHFPDLPRGAWTAVGSDASSLHLCTKENK
jgi:hypothetical protein